MNKAEAVAAAQAQIAAETPPTEPMVSLPASVAIGAVRLIEQAQVVQLYLALRQGVDAALAPPPAMAPVTQPEPETTHD